jgi:hypothetical protein
VAQKPQGTRYAQLIERIFSSRYKPGTTSIPFERKDIEPIARALGIVLPKNLGDIIYSFRYRTPLPESIRKTAPEGSEWVIAPAGRSKYAFVLSAAARITPNLNLAETKVPDSTPGVIAKYALTDEQSLLAKLRYNRLVDVFTSVTCYSLQSHLRTTVEGVGQVETDEVYIGLDRRGAHYVFPIQAKREKDTLSVIQIQQDIAMCREKWPDLICRPVAAQLMERDLIALFEFEQDKGTVRIVSERHYRLVPPEQLSPEDLEAYRRRTE